MGSEMLLYGYGIICLSMILFNLIYGLIIRGSENRLFRRSSRLEDLAETQLYRLRDGQPLEKGHIKKLQRKLSRVGNLMAFDRVLDRYFADGGETTVRDYLAQIQPVILYLAVVYRKRENLQAAYFVYFLNRHKLNKYMQVDTVQNILVDYMKTSMCSP